MTSVDGGRATDAHTPVEQRLIESVVRGEVLDLAADGPVDGAAMRSWGDDRTVSASVIRELVRGRLAVDADPHGLRLRGARIAGRLDLANIASELALELRDCFLPGGVSLRDAQLLSVAVTGCRIELAADSTESAVDATGLVARALSLNGSTVTAGTAAGAVRLLRARIGTLDCAGARLANTVGPALDADGLQVDHSMFLCDGFAATSPSVRGTVRLLGAHIGGQLNCGGARLENTTGPALEADGSQVDRDVLLCDGFTALGGGGAVLLLTDARIGGAFFLDTDRETSIDVDGLTYRGLPQPASPGHWLTLLREHTPGYAAQPYQHLAAAYRAAGHDRDARTILIAQRRDQIRRAGLAGSERVWGRLTGFTLGYGYQPWRALLLLLATLAAAVMLSVVGGHHGGLAQKPAAAGSAAPAACTTIDQIGVGLDLGTPLIKTGARDRCQPTGTPTGQILTVAGWLLQLLAWTFATLFIAGFTSAVRKT
jgi:hypothetical protein